MYISTLLIDLGKNPDRPRPARRWLRNLYRVHQRLCMAFPTPQRADKDPHFVHPFSPDDFPAVHTQRSDGSGFLFRIDPQRTDRACIIVQSAMPPNWEYAFHNFTEALAAPPQVRTFAYVDHLMQDPLPFVLAANPTRKIKTLPGQIRKQGISREGERTKNGKRVPVKAENLAEWLARKGEMHGFVVEKDKLTLIPAYYCFSIPPRKEGQNVCDEGEDEKTCGKTGKIFIVRFMGELRVTDVARFREALIRGIGPSKSFGCGLMTVPRLMKFDDASG